mmetsp:Transcript_23778/g.54463  ORF Transcript_23778/g.54463 Transcript_23778/m.54463 type:complete len:453 (+) Transcript_23778:355-1713(+)
MNQMQEADEEADDYHGTHARLGLLWPLSGSNRLMKYRVKSRLTKQSYSYTNAISQIGKEMDALLELCDNASNTTQALRTIAIIATAIQFMTLHISKVTNYVIHVINEGHSSFFKRHGGLLHICIELMNERCNCQHQFQKMIELMTGLISVFSEYSTDNLHPYFDHKNMLIHMKGQLLLWAQHSTGFLQPPHNRQTNPTILEIKRYQEEYLPQFYSMVLSLRELVLVFNEDGRYSKSITLKIVKRFPSGSPERRQAILQLDEEGRAAKASVYEELKKDFPTIVYDEWRRRVRQTKYSCILLDLHPVLADSHFKDSYPTMGIFSPKCHDIYNINLCESLHKSQRYYFCPRRFPPPYDGNKMWDCDSSRRLVWYVKHCAEKGGSPVFCNGGTGGTRRFRCTKRTIEGKKCRFGFTVCCDLVHGYYISFHNHSSGCKVNHLKHDQHKSNKYCKAVK